MVRPKRRRRRRSLVSLKIELQNKRNKRRYSKRYLQLLNYIKLRDGYSCQHPYCKNPKGVKLTVHHIQRWADKKALRENKFNLISLCYTCHKEVTGKEKRYEAKFKIIARRNELNYKKNQKTREQILEEQRQYQQLPDDFKAYEYKSDEEVTRVKQEEFYLRKTWRLIKFRTQNKNSKSYKNYGARGIKMYSEWIDDFDKFQQYVLENLGERAENASDDRIDNDKGYEPGNIRWATDEEQGQNRRTTVLDEDLVAVILILYYKYKIKVANILDRLNLPNRSLINSVIHGLTWTNVSYKYLPIITNEKAIQKIKDKQNGRQT